MRSALRPLQFVSAREVCFEATAFNPVTTINIPLKLPQGLLLNIRTGQADVISQVEVGHGKKAIVIFVPVPLLPGFHKVQQRYAHFAHTHPLISLPLPQLHHSPQQRTNTPPFSLTRELEKKFSDRHVLILASRRILPRPKRSNRSRTSQTQKRPHSRTLTAVHDAILADVVYPVEIVGKRVRTREDGSKVTKVVLDEKERGSVDFRLDTYAEVYRRLTGKGVNFEFPVGATEY